MESTKLSFGPGTFISYASIVVGSYTLVGIFIEPARVILVQNFTDVFLKFSTDDIFTDNFILPPNGFLLIDAGTNKGTPQTAAFHAATSVFATTLEMAAPTVGYVAASYLYAG